MRNTICLVVCLAANLAVNAVAAQEVTLPLDRYEELRRQAHPEAVKPAAAAALEEAKVTVEVGTSSARLVHELVVELYGEGVKRLTLPAAGTFVEADFGTIEGRLEAGDDVVLALRGQGRHRLRLVSVVAVEDDETATRPTRRLELEAPEAAVVHGVLRAGDGVEAVDASGAVVLSPPSDDGGRPFVAAPGASFTLTLRGAAVTPERDRLPLRWSAVSASVVEVARHRRRLETRLAIEVRQGRLETLRATLPEGFEVVEVDGPVAGWETDGGVLEVTPLDAVTGTLNLGLELLAPPADGFASPVVEVLGAADVLVASKVDVAGDALLDLVDPGAAREAGPREEARLPAAFRAAPGLGLVVPAGGEAPRWELTWSDATEVLAVQVDRLQVEGVVGEDGHAALTVWAVVRSRGAAQLVLGLGGAELVSGRRDGLPFVPGRSQVGWVVPLAATAEAQVIELALLLPLALPSGDGELVLPLPSLSAPVARVAVRLHLPGVRRYEVADRDHVGGVGPPPGPRVVTEAPLLASQLAVGQARPVPRGGVTAYAKPSGFSTVEASWSALSATPAPLVVEVEAEKSREEWF